MLREPCKNGTMGCMKMKNPAIATIENNPMPLQGRRIGIDDVIVRTAGLFLLLLAGAAVGWNFLPANLIVVLGLSLVALVLVFAVMRSNTMTAPLAAAYAIIEGLLVGALSSWYAAAYGGFNIIFQAVTATLVVFAVVLAGYKGGFIKVTSKSRRIFLIALVSYMVLGLASLVAAMFGVGGGWGFYGVGPIGILISVVAIGLASYSLAIDFDDVNIAIQQGADPHTGWKLGVGLLVSLVWLYLEILRLLAITRD